MSEVKSLILGWFFVLLSAFMIAFSIGWAMAWFIPVIWGLILVYGVYLLVSAFLKHQKPNIPEYIQYYRDQLELSLMAHPVPLKKTEKK